MVEIKKDPSINLHRNQKGAMVHVFNFVRNEKCMHSFF